MPLYEHVFLARQDLSAQQVEELTNQFKGILETMGGKVAKTGHIKGENSLRNAFLGLIGLPQCSMKGRNGIPNGIPSEGFIVQAKYSLNGNDKADALGADRFTLIIVLTTPQRGSGPSL